MPELPDVAVYIECLKPRIGGRALQSARVASPFLLRTVDPPLAAAVGRSVVGFRRVGKRIAIGFEGDLFVVFHLMIAGRLHWRDVEARLAGKRDLAGFWFPNGALTLTEAGAAFVLSRGRFGEVFLFGPAPQTSYDSAKPDERFFSQLGEGEDAEALDKRIERENRFDPDIWVVEIEAGSVPIEDLISIRR